MLAIVAQTDARLTPGMVADRALAKLPRFARPRYLAFRSSLPKTSTAKVRKAELKADGVTPDTIDLAGHYGDAP